MKKHHLNPNSKTLCQDVRQFVKNTWKIPLTSKPVARFPKKTNEFSAKNKRSSAEEETKTAVEHEEPRKNIETKSSFVKVEETPAEIKQENNENPFFLRNFNESRKENEGSMTSFEENERKKREMQQMMVNYWGLAQRNNNLMLSMNNPLNLLAIRQQQLQMAWNRQMLEKMAFAQRNSMNFGFF